MKKISRRNVNRGLGLVAGGAAWPAWAGTLTATPDQVEGPFYPPLPHGETDVDLTLLDGHTERATGDVILVRGRVTDTAGQPLAGTRVDIWQANHWGRYAHPDDPNSEAPLDPDFQGIGITETDADGFYGFKTIKPAAYPLNPMGGSGWRARHIHFKVATGTDRELTTQMYFEGDPLLEDDIVLRRAPKDAQHLLITTGEEDPETGLPLHRFDIALA